MLCRTKAGEIVFWILFVGMAFGYDIHWSYLILPGLIFLESLLTNNNKNQSND